MDSWRDLVPGCQMRESVMGPLLGLLMLVLLDGGVGDSRRGKEDGVRALSNYS